MMKMLRFILLFFIFAGLSFAFPEKIVAFIHVTVIDATGAPAQRDMTVIIRGTRISEIGKSDAIPLPKDADVIPASGKFLIPGLSDMHVHLFQHVNSGPPAESYFPFFIANGVTNVREMWTKFEDMKQLRLWRQQFASGFPMLRICQAGIMVDGLHPVWPNADTIQSPEEGRAFVRKAKEEGLDFIKVYWNLSREKFYAIADESKKLNMPFAGHVPFDVGAGEASDAGIKSIEHLTEMTISCSSREEELRKIDPKDWNTKNDLEVLKSYDGAKCRKLFARFVKNGTWQVPTLVMWQRMVLSENALKQDPRLKYVSATKREEWEKSLIEILKNRTSDEVVYGDLSWKRYVELVRAMHRAGVGIMAGTDTGSAVSYIYPGFSLHDELALFVKAGFTPMEALQAATREPAKFLGKLDSMGTVEKGKIADLVLLDANPLEDIHNTEKIAGVVLDGKFLGQEALQKMLANAKSDVQH